MNLTDMSLAAPRALRATVVFPGTAQRLEAELARNGEVLAPLSEQIGQLQQTTASLEGSPEHVLDLVLGLSAEKAQERGREVAAGG